MRVRLASGSTKTISVTVASANTSALAGSDYTALASTVVTFNPGQTLKTVTVPITNDAVYEGLEAFAVNLSSAVNAPHGGCEGHCHDRR